MHVLTKGREKLSSKNFFSAVAFAINAKYAFQDKLEGQASIQSMLPTTYYRGKAIACGAIYNSTPTRTGLRGGNGGNCPGPPAAKRPPLWNLFVSNKKVIWKILMIQKRYKNTTLPLYSHVALSIRGPRQQLISLKQGLQPFAIAGRITFIYMKYGHQWVRVIFIRCV